MTDKELLIEHFDFLVDLGFSVEEINKQLRLWCDGMLENVNDLKYSSKDYVDNLNYMRNETEEEDFILYMLFLYTDAFMMKNEWFKDKLDSVKNMVGDNYIKILNDDFWENGECKIFELMCYLTDEKNKWNNELIRLGKQMKARIDEGKD